MRYSTEELEAMPVNILRNVDIQSQEEEALIQRILSKKQLDLPIEIDLTLRSSQTDNMSPEKEAELQAVIDAEKAEARKKFEIPEEIVVTNTEPTASTEVPLETPVTASAFCQYCTAKGPVKHKNDCTRLSGNTNINE